jgi:hypothetical protein
VALGSTEPLTEISTMDVPWAKGGRFVELTTLPPSCADCVEIMGASTSWSSKGHSRDCFVFTFYRYVSPYLFRHVHIPAERLLKYVTCYSLSVDGTYDI